MLNEFLLSYQNYYLILTLPCFLQIVPMSIGIGDSNGIKIFNFFSSFKAVPILLRHSLFGLYLMHFLVQAARSFRIMTMPTDIPLY